MERMFFVAACVGLNVMAQAVPPGAAALGYTNCIINDSPTTAEIAPGTNGHYAWFAGMPVSLPNPSTTNFSTVSNVLALNFTGPVAGASGLHACSTPLDFTTGALPTLSASNGFYVEFDAWISGTNADHWPAVWLMPVEHNVNWWGTIPLGSPIGDHYDGATNFERWMEIDVFEGGWGPGLLGTVHSWTGYYVPEWTNQDYTSVWNPNNVDSAPLDLSKKHTFGASYNPVNQTVTWWVDGVEQMSAGPPYVPAIAPQQHFYLILSAQSFGANVPYTMYVSGVRAYVPPMGSGPPANFHVISP